ncbi:MAG: hypothetical protein IPO21_16725 [Bacteroidales bacterium]|nr:hypothetical protein [Bacteroidales bacterium]
MPINPRELYGKDIPFPVAIGYANEITLPHYLSSFTINFASIDPLNNRNIMYAYKLDGLEDAWIQADANSRHANYSALQPGTYTFQVKACTEKGNWSQINSVLITVVPPWWRTIWFRFGLSLFVALAITGFVFYRFSSLRKVNKMLEQQVQIRTESLFHKNEILNEKQLVIEMKNQQLKEVLNSKDQLISVLAHDFKNPLNGILGISTLLHKESDNSKYEKFRKYTSTLLNSVNALITQMMTVLDWVQSEDAKLQASPVEINLEVLLDDAISLETSNATRKKITITTHTDYSSNALVDPRMASMVFRNILSNAIKFTEQNGTIIVFIQELENTIDTTFIDSGIGMSNELINTILSRNEAVFSSYGTENEKGTGLGLRICKSFLEKNSRNAHNY